ncbi:MAG: iron-containing alcohol dehydrogenase family protein [Gaiellales bacterium]
MIDPFRLHLPVEIQFGEGVSSALPDVLQGLGASRALAVVEAPVAGLPELQAALAACGVVIEKPAGEPTPALVDHTAARCRAERADAVVGIGGGSALDVAKAARACAELGVGFHALLDGEVQPVAPRLPLVTIPTTSGTGSEVSGGAVVVDGGRKRGVASPLMRAQAALVDPLLTIGLSPAATAQTGVDALAQAISGVTVPAANPASAALGLEACRLIAQALPAAVRDGRDTTARSGMSAGSLLAGLSMNLSDTGADHALGHALGAVLGIPHGLSVGLVLAETLDVSRADCAAELERVADALGGSGGGGGEGARAVLAVKRLLADVGFPTCRAAGVDASRMDELVVLALDDYCLGVDAHRWSEGDVREAFAAALELDRR